MPSVGDLSRRIPWRAKLANNSELVEQLLLEQKKKSSSGTGTNSSSSSDDSKILKMRIRHHIRRGDVFVMVSHYLFVYSLFFRFICISRFRFSFFIFRETKRSRICFQEGFNEDRIVVCCFVCAREEHSQVDSRRKEVAFEGNECRKL